MGAEFGICVTDFILKGCACLSGFLCLHQEGEGQSVRLARFSCPNGRSSRALDQKGGSWINALKTLNERGMRI